MLLGTPAVHAALWHNGRVSDLGTLGGYESVGYGINDRGVVVGAASNTVSDPYTANFFNFFIQAATQVHAFLWDGSLHDLHTLGAGTDSVAFYINGKGQVAGQSFTDTTINATTGLPTMHPFLWENGKIKDLGTLGGTLVTTLAALNGSGEVVGSMTLKGDLQGAPDGYTRHPFLWDGHAMRDLGTLGGTSPRCRMAQRRWSGCRRIMELGRSGVPALYLARRRDDWPYTTTRPVLRQRNRDQFTGCGGRELV